MESTPLPAEGVMRLHWRRSGFGVGWGGKVVAGRGVVGVVVNG